MPATTIQVCVPDAEDKQLDEKVNAAVKGWAKEEGSISGMSWSICSVDYRGTTVALLVTISYRKELDTSYDGGD